MNIIRHHDDYPPENDDPCVVSIPVDIPEYFTQYVFWDECGKVFIQQADEQELRHDLFEFEPTDDQDADEAALKTKVEAIFAANEAEIQALDKAVEQAWHACQNKPVPDFDEFWDDIKDYVGMESEPGDPYPIYDDGEWFSHADIIEFQIENGERFVVVTVVDGDGSSDAQYNGKDEFPWAYREAILTDHFFHQWAKYWLWCASHGGIDPLSECRYFKHGPLTMEKCIKYAKDDLKHLTMSKENSDVQKLRDKIEGVLK